MKLQTYSKGWEEENSEITSEEVERFFPWAKCKGDGKSEGVRGGYNASRTKNKT